MVDVKDNEERRRSGRSYKGSTHIVSKELRESMDGLRDDARSALCEAYSTRGNQSQLLGLWLKASHLLASSLLDNKRKYDEDEDVQIQWLWRVISKVVSQLDPPELLDTSDDESENDVIDPRDDEMYFAQQLLQESLHLTPSLDEHHLVNAMIALAGAENLMDNDYTPKELFISYREEEHEIIDAWIKLVLQKKTPALNMLAESATTSLEKLSTVSEKKRLERNLRLAKTNNQRVSHQASRPLPHIVVQVQEMQKEVCGYEFEDNLVHGQIMKRDELAKGYLSIHAVSKSYLNVLQQLKGVFSVRQSDVMLDVPPKLNALIEFHWDLIQEAKSHANVSGCKLLLSLVNLHKARLHKMLLDSQNAMRMFLRVRQDIFIELKALSNRYSSLRRGA